MSPTFEFDRYVNGRLMAEGVTIERQPTLERAMEAAAKIASRGPRGEKPVLVYRPDFDRVKQLEEALRPFKAIADAVFYLHDDGAEANADKPDHYAVWGFNSAELTYGDLRRVRALLGGPNEPE